MLFRIIELAGFICAAGCGIKRFHIAVFLVGIHRQKLLRMANLNPAGLDRCCVFADQPDCDILIARKRRDLLDGQLYRFRCRCRLYGGCGLHGLFRRGLHRSCRLRRLFRRSLHGGCRLHRLFRRGLYRSCRLHRLFRRSLHGGCGLLRRTGAWKRLRRQLLLPA